MGWLVTVAQHSVYLCALVQSLSDPVLQINTYQHRILKRRQQMQYWSCTCFSWGTWKAQPGFPGWPCVYRQEAAACPRWQQWPVETASTLCLHWGECTSAGGGPGPSCPGSHRQRHRGRMGWHYSNAGKKHNMWVLKRD